MQILSTLTGATFKLLPVLQKWSESKDTSAFQKKNYEQTPSTKLARTIQQKENIKAELAQDIKSKKRGIYYEAGMAIIKSRQEAANVEAENKEKKRKQLQLKRVEREAKKQSITCKDCGEKGHATMRTAKCRSHHIYLTKKSGVSAGVEISVQSQPDALKFQIDKNT